MKIPVTTVLGIVLLGGCATTLPQSGSGYESASLSTPMVGRWEGAAFEIPGYHDGTEAATLTLDLKPDGTWNQTWTERGRTVSDGGRWDVRGRSVVLVSSGGTHRRLTLRRQSNEFYGVTSESLVDSRATLMTIELQRADTNRE